MPFEVRISYSDHLEVGQCLGEGNFGKVYEGKLFRKVSTYLSQLFYHAQPKSLKSLSAEIAVFLASDYICTNYMFLTPCLIHST